MKAHPELKDVCKFLNKKKLSDDKIKQKNAETISTYMLTKVLEAYDEIPAVNFRRYLVALIESNRKIDKT